jgi:hypothetical protein
VFSDTALPALPRLPSVHLRTSSGTDKAGNVGKGGETGDPDEGYDCDVCVKCDGGECGGRCMLADGEGTMKMGRWVEVDSSFRLLDWPPIPPVPG